MATASPGLAEKYVTQCTVCHDKFHVPKFLPCGHRLCRSCLVNWLRSQPQAGCPLCRCVIVDSGLAAEGRSADEVADGFPTDLAMSALVEAETMLSEEHRCCVCSQAAAVALCLQCGETFCQHCSTLHRRQSATKDHEVEELADLDAETLAARQPAACPSHREKVTEVFCRTHGVDVCLLCAFTHHRDCPQVVSLHSRVEELSGELAQLSSVLADAESRLDSSLAALDHYAKELLTQSRSAQDQIQIVCDSLKAAIDAHLQDASSLASRMVSEVVQQAEDAMELLTNKRASLTTHRAVTELYSKFQEHRAFGDMVSTVKNHVQALDLDPALPDKLRQRQLIMIVDPQAVARIEQELSRLVSISLAPIKKDKIRVSRRDRSTSLLDATDNDGTSHEPPLSVSQQRAVTGKGRNST